MSVNISIDVNSGNSDGSSTHRPFELIAFPFPPGHFLVHSFSGREGLSEPYSLDIVVSSKVVPGLDIEQIALGQRAVFFLRATKVPRAVHGVVQSIRTIGSRSHGRRIEHRIRLVPAFALLRHHRRSRIFQNLSVPEVVEEVLSGFPTQWLLAKAHPKRAYVTQYQETDRAFVERILAEAGIFYFFTHPGSLLQELVGLATDALESMGPLGSAAATAGSMAQSVLEREAMVFGDTPDAYALVDDGSLIASVAQATGLPTSVSAGPVTVSASSPTMHYYDQPGLAVERFGAITAFVPERHIRSTQAEYREYDPDRPHFRLGSRVPSESLLDQALSAVDVDISVDPSKGADAVDASVSFDWAQLLPQPVYEEYRHHGAYHFPNSDDAAAEATRILARARRRAVLAKGRTLSTGIVPGHRFTLDQHPIAAVNREYVVTRVKHRGSTAEEERFHCAFECVPSDVPFLPLPSRRPNIQAALTATVVGPGNEEIHVDAQGRIKVHFHWDRAGASETSSCWIRTMQTWGGASWGSQFIPRVGMEVVVGFDGGDPDKPIVLGCVYNATHPMPFALPGDKTRSGIRSRTVGNASGFNELSFQDKKDGEQIFVHAQRDLDEVVERDHTLDTRRDEKITVRRDRIDHVEHDSTERVGRNAKRTVGGDQDTVVEGSRIDAVAKDHHVRVTGTRDTRIEAGEVLDVKGAAELLYASTMTTRVHQHLTTIVGRHEAKGTSSFHVEGAASLSATDVLELSCEKEIVFRVGKSSIRIGKDRIDFASSAVGTQGGGAGLEASKAGLKLSSDGGAQLVAKEVVLKTEAASIAMASEVRLDGARVLLNAPTKAKDEERELEPPTRIELTDQDGNALALARYLIKLDDGTEQSGVLGEDGTIELELLQSGTISFPDLPNAQEA